MQCISCSSENLKSLGMRMHGPEKYIKYVCEDCGEELLLPPEYEEDPDPVRFIKSDEFINKVAKSKRLVVTCAQNNTPVNQKFLESLETFCDSVVADLVIIPIRYKNNDGDLTVYSDDIQNYLCENPIKLVRSDVRILGNLKISPTAENPLSGLDPMSKGNTLIVAHPQVMLKTLPQHGNGYPPFLVTTGAITEKNYIQSKVGFKAEFNHSMSAALIESDDDGTYFIRHLNFDGEGFCDLGKYYQGSIISDMETLGIVTGDEHVVFSDPSVASATYFDENSIVKTLKPKIIVRHDVLDFYSGSSHHKKNIFTNFAKWKSGINCVATELDRTLQFINETTPEDAETWIVSSNHNQHLLRWLNECDPKIEPWNAIVYHGLMYQMLKETKMSDGGAVYPDPFELYANLTGTLPERVQFLGRLDQSSIADVDVGFHGDIGVNGSRGSRPQFSILPTKTIIGHSHSPGITRGCYQVGTSSNLKMEYNTGPSSWHQAHCLIYGNGKRQLVFIVNGRYRLK